MKLEKGKLYRIPAPHWVYLRKWVDEPIKIIAELHPGEIVMFLGYTFSNAHSELFCHWIQVLAKEHIGWVAINPDELAKHLIEDAQELGEFL